MPHSWLGGGSEHPWKVGSNTPLPRCCN